MLETKEGYQLRVFIIHKKVMHKIMECRRFKSAQLDVEIIKFVKSVISHKEMRTL
jgi:hypothetical protein